MLDCNPDCCSRKHCNDKFMKVHPEGRHARIAAGGF
jgi:hypothetical protein